MHKYCMEETFKKKKNRCPECDQIIFPGYQSALLTKRLVNSEVLKLKNEHENGKIFNGNYGTIGVGAQIEKFDPPHAEENENDDIEDEVVDVNIDVFLENEMQMEEAKEPNRQTELSANISNMISQYNACQPDFGEKIEESKERRPFVIKHNKTRILNGVASGHSAVSNNRARLEQGRRQMVMNNIGGTPSSIPSQHEEEKKIARKPPRGSSKSKKFRHKPKSLRKYNNYSGTRDPSFMNNSGVNTTYGRINKSNRITPPCPVRIPKAVTDGIAMLKSIRLVKERGNRDSTYISSQIEESKSPPSNISTHNVSSRFYLE